LFVSAMVVVGCSKQEVTVAPGTAGALLYVWAGDADHKEADFLAVVDADSASSEYGKVIATVPVEGRDHWPHHTEYAVDGSTLWANGWSTGSTFIFDLATPRAPTVRSSFTARGGYAYPHSYARLPNGHVLATFQTKEGGYTATGALVELDSAGTVVRSASGIAPGVKADLNWTYSLLVLPDLDRVVTTNTRMGTTMEWMAMAMPETDPKHEHATPEANSTHVMVYRLSDLKLLHTVELPAQDGGHNRWTAEPRRLANGEVYVNTFSCGLYHLSGVGSDAPKAQPVLSTSFTEPGYCSVPVTVGNYWVQPSATDHTVVSWDLSDTATPRVASQIVLDSAHADPHWLALDPSGTRIVLTFDSRAWVMLIDLDPATGKLTVDERFRDAGATNAGVSFDRAEWPHGANGRAQPHGAVFSAKR